MRDMFAAATDFDQNLGNWYVVPDSVSIAWTAVPGVVGSISAQNTALNEHNPVYNVTGSDSTRFAIVNGNQLNMTSVDTESDYTVNVTASDGTVFEDGNNWRVLNITVSGGTNIPPEVQAGDDQTVGEGDTVTLSGNATDSNGDSMTYAWSQTVPVSPRIAFANASESSTTFTAPAVTGDTTFTLTLTVHDGTQSAADALNVTVRETGAAFITTWTASDSDRGITLPMDGTYSVLWGDDTYSPDVSGSQSHTYAAAGNYTVTVLGDGLDSISLYDDDVNALQIQSIEQWGGTEWTTMKDAFEGASNMTYRATDAPNLSNVTSTSGMFWDASSFDGDLSGWNVSSVTEMLYMFSRASSFNGDISGWDVSSVNSMNSMFFGASSFNGDLSSWNVSSVIDMHGMFLHASNFNQPLDDWDVSSVESMDIMFFGASDFDQNLGAWYIVPAGTDFVVGGTSLNVTTISAQNPTLRDHNPEYGIVSDGNLDPFEMRGSTLAFKAAPDKGSYQANVTASGADVFKSGNNWRMLNITVSDSPPTVQAGDDQTVGEGDTVTLSGFATDTDDDPITYTWSQTAPALPLITFVNASAPLTTFTAPAVTGDTAFTLVLTAHDGTQPATDMLNITVKETGTAFITTWTASDSDRDITLPMHGTYSVLWGDGTYSLGVSNYQSHSYGAAGTYTVTVLGNDLESISTVSPSDPPNALQLQSIEQWGATKWTTLSDAFKGAANMVYRATDAPDLSDATDINSMFHGATSFNGDLSSWNVSSIIYMPLMFDSATSFNGNISGWDVSSVTDMNNMFFDAIVFNQTLNDWDVSSVEYMGNMFRGATSFDQPLNDWILSSIDDMNYMFIDADSFDQNLGTWYIVPTATSFDADGASLNVTTISAQNSYLRGQNPVYGIVSEGNSELFEMSGSTLAFRSTPSAGTYQANVTASGSAVFESGNNWRMLEITVSGSANSPPAVQAGGDQTVGEGNIVTLSGSATDMDGNDITYVWSQTAHALPLITFANASAPLTTFTAPAVTGDTTFTLTLTADDGTQPATDMLNITVRETGTAFITTWAATSSDKDITLPMTGTYSVLWGDGSYDAVAIDSQSHTYAAAGLYTVTVLGEGLESINLSYDAANARQLRSIEQWGGTKWTTMSEAFDGAANMAYNATDSPNLSKVNSTSSMFNGASSFDGDLSSWNVSSVTDMNNMFRGASSFNQSLNSWNVSSVADMTFMFNGASSFNQPLNDWDVSSVTNMHSMFFHATDFDQPLDGWDVSSVTSMKSMFNGASAFNANLSAWNVSSVTNMRNMFNDASTFNANLSAWNVSSVTDMRGMFRGASVFDGSLDAWDVSLITTMNNMFFRAINFDQPLDAWNVSSVTDMSGMFASATSFNRPLDGWDVSSVIYMNNMFDNAHAFNQNLGMWYIVLDDTAIDLADTGNDIGSISVQNSALDVHSPTYGLDTDLLSQKFAISGNDLQVKSGEDYPNETYNIIITATGTNLFGTDN